MTEIRHGVLCVEREDFVSSRFHYHPGEHVTFLGRTNSGKTTLAYQLLEHITTPEMPVLSLVVKPRSPTVDKWRKRLQHPLTRTWPPAGASLRKKPAGWTVWPKHSFDPDRDDAMLYVKMRTAMMDAYKRGKRIVFADETLGLSLLGLDKYMVVLWTRGREMPTGLWAATQKPSHIPLYAYNQATHLFLAKENDKRGRQRFGEISGFDARFIETLVMSLRKWEWLYINQDDDTICIVLP